MRLVRALLLLVAVSIASCGDDASTPVDAGPASDVPGADVPGLAEAEALRAGLRVGLCDGDLLRAEDLAPLDDAIGAARALRPDAPRRDVEAAAAALEAAALSAREAPRISHREDLAALYDGVSAIRAPGGAPSRLAAVGCEALMVFAAEDLALGAVAAGRVGAGRVLVLSKEVGSYLPTLADASVDADMARFAGNALSWLTAGNAAGLDARRAAGEAMPVLVTTGFDALDPSLGIEMAEPIDDPRALDPARVPLAIVDPRLADDEVADAWLDYARRGGALLMGHQVWSWDVDVRTSAAQRLLLEAGLLWAPWYAEGGGPAPPVERLLRANVSTLLDWLAEVERRWPERAELGFRDDELDAIVALVVAAHEWLPPARGAYVEALEARFTGVDVTYPADVSERPYARVVVPAYHAARRLAPDQPPGKSVEVFPGLVPDDAPRVTREVTYDFDRADPGYVRTSVPPGARLSTALYAPPGEALTVTVTLDGRSDLDLRILIGCHTDDLSHLVELERSPRVAFSEPLVPGAQRVSNPYGGLVYLEAPRDAFGPGRAEVTIEGVIEAPFYDAAAPDPAWLDRPAPWGEISAGTLIATLPASQLAVADDPAELARAWADIVANTYDLMGLSADAAVPHRTPEGVNRFVEDVQISAGWMHSGHPIMAYVEAELMRLDNVRSWGPYHELGHNYQQSDWMLPDTGEVTTNLFSLYQQERFGQGSRLLDDGRWASTDARLDAGATWDALDVWEKLTLYRRLSLAFGWDFYRRLYAETRRRHHEDGAARAEGESAADYLLVQGSRLAGADLSALFARYGVDVSDEARAALAALALPSPDPAVEGLVETAP